MDIESLITENSFAITYTVYFINKPLRYMEARRIKDDGKTYITASGITGIPMRENFMLLYALQELIDKDIFGDPSK